MNNTATDSRPNTTTRWRDGDWGIRFIHLTAGWRYWAFNLLNTKAENMALGLDEDGYLSMAAARRAVAKARKAAANV